MVAQTSLPGRIEILALRSKTLSAEEFLRGNGAGREVVLGGELREGPNGIIVNAATQAPYSIKSDPCVAIGAHVGYNPDAVAAAREAVTAFIKQTLVN